MKSILLWIGLLGLISGCAIQAREAEESATTAVENCVLAAPDKLRLLWQVNTDPKTYHNIYTHPCSGKIYIVDPNRAGGELQPLWQGWWLQGLYPPRFTDGATLTLLGKFITGVGPTGSRPFLARLTANLTPTGWQMDEPELDVVFTDEPVVHKSRRGPLFEIRSVDALRALNLSLDTWQVDFERERLVFYNTDLSSGDAAQVETDGTTYFLWIKGRPIGSTYTRPGLAWMVVPKDELKVSADRNLKAKVCQHCRAGALRHGRVRWFVEA